MSYFADKTPHQELLDCILYVQHEYRLSKEELAILIFKIASALVDPFDAQSDALRNREKSDSGD